MREPIWSRCTTRNSNASFHEIEQLVNTAHTLFDEMERSPKPFVAAVEGACLGGGLELALACHVRIASTHPRTCFGLPEVKLGILPGFGGTQRLPRLIGLPAALDMITTGKTVFPRQALRMGLVEGMVTSIPSTVRTLENIQKEALVQAAIAQARVLCSAPVRRRASPGKPEILERSGNSFARVSLCATSSHQARPTFLSRSAPCHRCRGGRDGYECSGGIAYGRKASAFGSHGQPGFLTPCWLVPGRRGGETEGCHRFGARLTRVGVLGAGLMGSQIAGQLAEKGYAVVLRDVASDILATGDGEDPSTQTVQVRKRIIFPPTCAIA